MPVADEHGYSDNVWEFAEGLFTTEDNLWVLCIPCHTTKTQKENEERTNIRQKSLDENNK